MSDSLPFPTPGATPTTGCSCDETILLVGGLLFAFPAFLWFVWCLGTCCVMCHDGCVHENKVYARVPASDHEVVESI
jgi:hypothetical protein